MPYIEENLPKNKQKDDPEKRMSQIEEILNLDIEKGYMIETFNFNSWKTYFYKEKKEKFPDRCFTFRKDTKNNKYKVWRTK